VFKALILQSDNEIEGEYQRIGVVDISLERGQGWSTVGFDCSFLTSVHSLKISDESPCQDARGYTRPSWAYSFLP
jgi:hypothetical protein